MIDVRNELQELLHGSGEPLSGYSGDLHDAEVLAAEIAIRKPFCIVCDWRIIEVEVDDAYRASLDKDGLAPFVLYARQVVLHSAGRRRQGDWVRSTFQRSLTRGFFFETVNTLYVLIGLGSRKKGSGRTVLQIGR